MYDTEAAICDASRRKQERAVNAWMRAAAYAAGSEPDDESFAAMEPALDEVDLGQAVESKKRDNLALGEALVSIGLIGHGELARVRQRPDPKAGTLWARCWWPVPSAAGSARSC